jgi:hypothetical protein
MIVADVTLRAPIAIPVEVRAGDRRVFRLAAAIGEDGLRLETPVPFEGGHPVEARFEIPGGPRLALPARLDGVEDEPADALTFLEPPADARQALHRYVVERLELPA